MLYYSNALRLGCLQADSGAAANRVSPFGELCAFCARGLFMGNRGGRFHTDAKTLTARRWASRQWICCVLDFKGRRRDVWGRFYTELFFLYEPTALAAGNRPCFECRRKDAETFAEKWREARRLSRLPYAPEMDDVLHHERLRGGAKRLHRRNLDELPDGAFAAFDQTAFAIQGHTAALDTKRLSWPQTAAAPYFG